MRVGQIGRYILVNEWVYCWLGLGDTGEGGAAGLGGVCGVPVAVNFTSHDEKTPCLHFSPAGAEHSSFVCLSGGSLLSRASALIRLIIIVSVLSLDNSRQLTGRDYHLQPAFTGSTSHMSRL